MHTLKSINYYLDVLIYDIKILIHPSNSLNLFIQDKFRQYVVLEDKDAN